MKILHFIYGLNIGGAETFISNLINSKELDFEFHFVIQNPNITNEEIKNYIQSKNLPIVHLIPSFIKNPFSHYHALKKLLKSYDFDVVHIHVNSLMNPIPLVICKSLNIKIIIHSHNTSNSSGGKIVTLLHILSRTLFLNKHQNKIACSESAGKWMFKKYDFNVIDNAINLEKYKYNNFARIKTRRALGISDDVFVIGSVGRLVPQKNFPRLLEIFDYFKSKYPTSKLLIVGDGPQKEQLEKLKLELGLDGVIFVGSKQDPSPYYSSMDCFVMPSLFEGLGFTAIEAQASGLPVIASTGVPNIVNASGNVRFINLKDSNEQWSDALEQIILKFHKHKPDRIELGKKLKGSRFDLSSQSSKMRDMYLK